MDISKKWLKEQLDDTETVIRNRANRVTNPVARSRLKYAKQELESAKMRFVSGDYAFAVAMLIHIEGMLLALCMRKLEEAPTMEQFIEAAGAE